MTYIYLDGSANKFTMKNSFLTFDPVKPENSSSGTYDGGDYTKKEITNEQKNQIINLFKTAINNKESHIKNRIMTSGYIIIKDGKNENKVILAPQSKEKKELEDYLYSLIK